MAYFSHQPQTEADIRINVEAPEDHSVSIPIDSQSDCGRYIYDPFTHFHDASETWSAYSLSPTNSVSDQFPMDDYFINDNLEHTAEENQSWVSDESNQCSLLLAETQSLSIPSPAPVPTPLDFSTDDVSNNFGDLSILSSTTSVTSSPTDLFSFPPEGLNVPRRHSDTGDGSRLSANELSPLAHVSARGRNLARLNIFSAPGSRMPSPGYHLLNSSTVDENPFEASPVSSPNSLKDLNDIPINASDWVTAETIRSSLRIDTHHLSQAIDDQTFFLASSYPVTPASGFLTVPSLPDGASLRRRNTDSGSRPSIVTSDMGPASHSQASYFSSNGDYQIGIGSAPSITRHISLTAGNNSAVGGPRRSSFGRGRALSQSREASSSRQASPYAREGTLSSPRSPQSGGSLPQSPTVVRREVTTEATKRASLARRKNEGKFTCSFPECTSSFTAKHNLIRHQNAHIGAMRLVCDCTRSFTNKSDLKRHRGTSQLPVCKQGLTSLSTSRSPA